MGNPIRKRRASPRHILGRRRRGTVNTLNHGSWQPRGTGLPGASLLSCLPSVAWCLIISFLPPRLSKWSFPASPNGPFLPSWCLPGFQLGLSCTPSASLVVQLVLSCLPDASPVVQLVLSCIPSARRLSNWSFPTSLVPPRLSKWSFPASLVPPCCPRLCLGAVGLPSAEQISMATDTIRAKSWGGPHGRRTDCFAKAFSLN